MCVSLIGFRAFFDVAGPPTIWCQNLNQTICRYCNASIAHENIFPKNLHLRPRRVDQGHFPVKTIFCSSRGSAAAPWNLEKIGQNRLKILPSDDSIVVGIAVPTLVVEKDHGSHLAFVDSNQFRRICSRSLPKKQVKNWGKSQITVSIGPCSLHP